MGLIGLVAHALTEYGMDAIFVATVKELYKKGETKEAILKKINQYPFSKLLKCRLRDEINSCT